MFKFGSNKKLEQAQKKISELKGQLSEIQSSNKKRLAESTYLFSGDVSSAYRKSDNQDRSDLPETDYWSLQKQCYDAFKIFPYAKRVIEITTDFVIGSELTYSVDEKYQKEVTPIIDDLWNDYDNNFDLMLEGMINELWVLGEQVYPVTFQEFTNVLKLGIVDPRSIEKILRSKENQKRLIQIVMQNDSYNNNKIYGIIGEVGGRLGVSQEAKTVPMGSTYAGDVFLFNINRLPTQTRGYSELVTMVETLDVLDQFIFQVSERSLLLYHFIADFLIKNKSEEEIEDFKVPDPRKNATFKHNQNVEMSLHTPDIKAVDADVITKLIIRYILAGVGIPEHWIVHGGDTNLATAREQNNPIEKRLERKQGTVKYMLKTIIRYQIEKRMKQKSNREIKEIMKAVNIDFPSVAGVDRKLRAQVMNETAKALVIGTVQGWITNKDAGQEFINLANKFGMELSAVLIDDDTKNDLNSVTGKNFSTGSDIQAYLSQLDKMADDGSDAVPPAIKEPQGVE